MITKGWGKANCFYLGVALASPGEHRFQCRNMEKLAKDSTHQLAFQYTISNTGKSLPLGDPTNDATKNIVNTVSKTLSCELKINTYTSATSSAVLWYQSKFTAQVDGNTRTSKSGQWSSFIGVADTFPSLGQKSAASNYVQEATAKDAEVWLLLSSIDKTG